MGNSRSNGTSLWLRMSEWLRVSAWFPLALALGWLAALATFLHNVGILLAAWGATVSVVLVIVLLTRRRHEDHLADRTEAASRSHFPTRGPFSEPEPGQAVAVNPLLPELRVLTAEEVASALRVDADLIITSIINGELPGNRIGSHWRVDQRALTRWLEGPYGNRVGKDTNR